jgi:hypothetical protein
VQPTEELRLVTISDQARFSRDRARVQIGRHRTQCRHLIRVCVAFFRTGEGRVDWDDLLDSDQIAELLDLTHRTTSASTEEDNDLRPPIVAVNVASCLRADVEA